MERKTAYRKRISLHFSPSDLLLGSSAVGTVHSMELYIFSVGVKSRRTIQPFLSRGEGRVLEWRRVYRT